MARRFRCSHIGHCRNRLSSLSFSSCSSAAAAGGIVIPELIHKVDDFSLICTSADGQHRNFSALGNFSGFYAPKIEHKANSNSVANLGFRGNNRLFCLRRAFSTNRRRNYSEDEDNDAAELFNSRGRGGGGGGGRIRGHGRGGGRAFGDNGRSNSGRRRKVDNFNGNGRFHGMSQRKDDFMEDSFASGRGTRGSGRGRISRHDSGRDYASNDRFGLEDDSEEESDGFFRPARRNEAFGRIKKYCEGSDDDDLDGLDDDDDEEDSDEFNDSFSTQRKDHKGYQETRFKDIAGKFPLKQNNGNVKRNRPVSMFQDRDLEGPLSAAFDKKGMVHEENKNDDDDDELGLSDQENDLYDEDSDESVEGDDGEKRLKKMGLRSHMDKKLDDDEDISHGSGGGGSRSLIDDERELNVLIDKEMISGLRFQDELLSSNRRGGGGSRESGSDLRRSNSNRRGTTRGSYSSTRFERRRSFSESDEDDGKMDGFGSTRGRKGGSRGSYSGGRFERRNSAPESDEGNDFMDDFSRTRGNSKRSGSVIGSSVRRDRRHSLKASPARRGRFMSSMVGLSP